MEPKILEITFVSTIFLITIYFHIKFDRFAVVHGPEILTTLGILGCFTGITVALFAFNPDNISQSVPNLLAGIKTAFWASLSGVLGALTIRFSQRFRSVKDNDNEMSGQTASLSDVVLSIEKLRSGIVGNKEESLLSHTKAIKDDSNKQFSALISEFKTFSIHIVENNQKAVIEALREVIKDFNTQLSEQFGENFKELNLAIGKLVLWQEQYKEELNLLQKNQESIRINLEKSSNFLNEIVKSSGSFEKVSRDLRSQIEFLNLSRDMLISQQKALADVLEKMSEITPDFSKKTNEMLNQIQEGNTEVQIKTSEMINMMANEIVKNQKEIKNILDNTFLNNERELEKIQISMTKACENLSIQMQISGNEFKKQITETLLENQKIFKNGLLENSNIVKQSVIVLDQALQKELNNSLESLGRQLASLSNKFVEDYTPLTDKLKKIVEITKKI